MLFRHGAQGIQDEASHGTLENEFGTHNEDECIVKILEGGTLQEVEVSGVASVFLLVAITYLQIGGIYGGERFFYCFSFFPLYIRIPLMLTLRNFLLAFSLHHARGQRMIARARVLRIEDDRRNVAQEGSLYNSTDIAVTEERMAWDQS